MSGITRICVVSVATILGACFVGGCGQSSSENPATESSSAKRADNPSTQAVTKAAADFLDAVLKGDTQRASARLTPQAMQRIIDSGKQFAPPGLDTATFRIGEVRSPTVDKAFVHCVLTDNSGAAPRSEEMCCLMRLVDNDWRVSGIAYWSGPNQAGTMSDFETGQSIPISRNSSMAGMSNSSKPAPSDGRYSPPRMAENPAATKEH